jgi:hypothetical protein
VSLMGVLDDQDSTLDLDSHAEIAVLGGNCRIIHDTGRTLQVYSYDPSQGPTTRSVVSGCFAYDDPQDGTAKILVVHQGVHVPGLPNSLIPPNQMRDNEVVVNECPKSMKLTPTAEDHSLIVQGLYETSYQMPLTLRGVISCLPVRYPTDQEFLDEGLERYELTYETPEWNPTDGDRADVEDTIAQRFSKGTVGKISTTHRGGSMWQRLLQNAQKGTSRYAISSLTTILRARALQKRSYGYVHPMAATMMTKCNISSIYAKRMTATGGLTIEALARNWMITLPQAKLTLDATTQKAIRTRPQDLVRRFKTNDRALRYTQLTCTVFTDTFKAETKSKRGNLYGQIYIAVPSGYMRVYAMKDKSRHGTETTAEPTSSGEATCHGA